MILNGWKEIGVYLNCSTRTAQRWQRLGLPVYRPNPRDRGAVTAFTAEIDRWLIRQNDSHSQRQTHLEEMYSKLRALSDTVAAVQTSAIKLQQTVESGRTVGERSLPLR